MNTAAAEIFFAGVDSRIARGPSVVAQRPNPCLSIADTRSDLLRQSGLGQLPRQECWRKLLHLYFSKFVLLRRAKSNGETRASCLLHPQGP